MSRDFDVFEVGCTASPSEEGLQGVFKEFPWLNLDSVLIIKESLPIMAHGLEPRCLGHEYVVSVQCPDTNEWFDVYVAEEDLEVCDLCPTLEMHYLVTDRYETTDDNVEWRHDIEWVRTLDFDHVLDVYEYLQSPNFTLDLFELSHAGRILKPNDMYITWSNGQRKKITMTL